jgi:hypothetical protein
VTVTLLDLLVSEATKAAEENALQWASDPFSGDIPGGLRRGIAAAKQAFSEIDETTTDPGTLVTLMKKKLEACLAHYRSLPGSMGEWECSGLCIIETSVRGLDESLLRIAAAKQQRAPGMAVLEVLLKAREQIRDQAMKEVAEPTQSGAAPLIQGHVFLSYVHENADTVDRLATLHRHGIEVWLDRTSIRPGTRWRNAIRDAIEKGAFFVACFSKEYETRAHSYMDEELQVAFDELRHYTSERGWFIAVRLNTCIIPRKPIGDIGDLTELQWVDLYPDWDAGIASLLEAVAQARKPPVKGGNEIVLDTARPFEERIRLACEAWVSGGRGAEGLLSGKAFFAAQCWVYEHSLFDVTAPSYDEPIAEFVVASREFCGGDRGWDRMLLDHVACEACRQNYRFENIAISTKRMMYLCPDCARAFNDSDEDVVG